MRLVLAKFVEGWVTVPAKGASIRHALGRLVQFERNAVAVSRQKGTVEAEKSGKLYIRSDLQEVHGREGKRRSGRFLNFR